MVDSGGTLGGKYLEYHLQIEEIYGSIFKNDFILGGYDFIVNALGVTNVIPNASACIFSTQALKALSWEKALSFQLSGDWWIYANLAIVGPIAFTAKALNYHRRHSLSVIHRSSRQPLELAVEAKRIHKEIYSIISADSRLQSVVERSIKWHGRIFSMPTYSQAQH